MEFICGIIATIILVLIIWGGGTGTNSDEWLDKQDRIRRGDWK